MVSRKACQPSSPCASYNAGFGLYEHTRSFVASTMARLKYTMLSRVPSICADWGILSKSLSSPTQRNFPCSHWVSKSCLKFRSAIGGHCIVSLQFRQLPAADEEHDDKSGIRRNDRNRKERAREIERRESGNTDKPFKGRKDIQGHCFFPCLEIRFMIRW